MISELDKARIRALKGNSETEGIVGVAEAVGLDTEGKKSLNRNDYQAYYDAQPHLHNYWNQSGGNWPSKKAQSLGLEDPKINAEINGGLGKKGNLTGDLKGISTESNECEKQGMGGKARSQAGFACWQFWHEVNKGNSSYYSGVGGTIKPTGVDISEADIKKALDGKTLSKPQKRNLMMARWGNMGFNKFNNIIDNTQVAFSTLYGKEMDDTTAALWISSNTESLPKLMTALESKNRREEYSLDEIVLDDLIDQGESYSINDENISEYEKATIPYDITNNSRMYGTTKVENGKRVETDEYYSSFDMPGFSEDSKLGSIYKVKNSDWSFQEHMGYFYKDPKSSDWVFSQKTGTWMYPHLGEGDRGLLFYAQPEGSDPEEEDGRWLAPQHISSGGYFDTEIGEYVVPTGNTTNGSYYDFKDDVYRTSEEIEQLLVNPKTGVGENLNQNEEFNRAITTTRAKTMLAQTPHEGFKNWYENERGMFYQAPESNWKHYTGSKVPGWLYDDPNSAWTYMTGAGWLWNDPEKSEDWWYSNTKQQWLMPQSDGKLPAIWMDENDQVVTFGGGEEDNSGHEDNSNPPASPGTEPGTSIPKKISYDKGGSYYDPDAILSESKNKLNDIARDLAYEGWDQGMIMGFLRTTEVYKDLGDWVTGRDDKVEAQGLVDGLIEQVAEVNARKTNIATTLDMFDAGGAAMLDPRMTLEEKLAIRTAKPSRNATQKDVDDGLAVTVGEVIRNPEYDAELSYYFEHVNPETGELETKAFRPDMPGKHSFMGIQEQLLDESKATMEAHLSDLVDPIGDTGKSKYQTALDKQIDSLKSDNIMAGGLDDSTTSQDESLGLYANEGAAALNYVYGEDENSQMGKMLDFNSMNRHLREQRNYLDSMDARRDLDISSKIRTAIGDTEPVERARERSAERLKLARLGGGEVNQDLGGIQRVGGMFDSQISPEIAPTDVSNITGLGDTYSQAELDASGTSGGLFNMPEMSTELEENQYAKNIISPKKTKFIRNDQTGKVEEYLED